MQITDTDLFNCCTGNAAPDWSRFIGLELGGCTSADGITTGGAAYNLAQFFTVYGRTREGEAEAITDIEAASGRERPTLLVRAIDVAAELSYRSGLPITLYRPNGSV